MSIIGVPSLAMLLVLTNIALCLSVAPQRPALTAVSTLPLGPAQAITGAHHPANAAMPRRNRLQID